VRFSSLTSKVFLALHPCKANFTEIIFLTGSFACSNAIIIKPFVEYRKYQLVLFRESISIN
jgi:hypothetical protein